MKILKGDLIQFAVEGHFDVIIHGCNCFGTMGAGIAAQIKKHFPAAYRADLDTPVGDKAKLGTYSTAVAEKNGHKIIIVNAYTQYDFSGRGRLTDYGAIKRVFSKIKNEFSGKKIAYPRIGAGLGRGDWSIISDIIDNELKGEDHTLVEYLRI
jgi:O-acetyl-ADP-ribose deacetylase (regulator of RNase III)